jgi:dephospho-CoA kinase
VVFDENQVNVRENFQFSLDKKRAIADNTVDNNSDFSVLSKQVAEIFTSLADSV